MSHIEWALKLWIAERRGAPLLLAPTIGGIPEAATPTYPLLRVSYLSVESAACDDGITAAKRELNSMYPLLLLALPCPDGPPNRSGVVFCRNATVIVNWSDGRHAKPQLEAEEYLAAVSLNRYPWGADVQRGRPGYFLTGLGGTTSLWRIARVESDIAGRQLFTLSPIQMANGLPTVDFSSIDNDLLRQKMERDWNEVQRCLANQIYSSLITATKNVAESLVAFAVGGPQKRMTFERSLVELGERLKADKPLRLPFHFLDYHLMSKLRILHGHTHSDRVVISGRLIDPEFALTVAADLVQLLKSTGLVRKP